MKRTPSLPLSYLKRSALGAAIVVAGCSRPTVELDVKGILEEGKRYCKREYPNQYEACAVAYAKAVERMREELRRQVHLASRGGGDGLGPALVGYMLGRDLGGGYAGGGGYRTQPYVPPPTLKPPPIRDISVSLKPTRTIQRGGFGSRAVGRFGWGG